MVEISNSDLDFEVSGYVSLPELTRANRNYITILINGRYIKNFLLNRAIFDGYGSKLMVGRFPIAVIDIQIDPYLADVNVHPTKQEVRISKEKELMALISSAIAQSLREQDLIPDALENLAKSSTRGAAKPVQTSLPLKQTNLYYDSSRNDFFVKPETVQEDIKPLVSESPVSSVENKPQPSVKQAQRSVDEGDSEHEKLDYKNKSKMKRMLETLDNEETSTFPELEFLVKCMEPISLRKDKADFTSLTSMLPKNVSSMSTIAKRLVRLTAVYSSFWFPISLNFQVQTTLVYKKKCPFLTRLVSI